MSTTAQPSPRISSLDQFRGYTVAGMFLVNYIGRFAAIPHFFAHNWTYCSYADTIMPQFFFVVGFAFRLTFLKRLEREGTRPAWRHAILRSLGLILVGAILYQLDGRFQSWGELQKLGLWGFFANSFKSHIFQTLVHIAVTCLWVLPVIASSAGVRVLFIVGSGVAHLALSHFFYHQWALNNHAIDGGPLGFLTWTIPLLVGSLAYDAISARGPRRAIPLFLRWSIVLMALGYGLSCLNAVSHNLTGAIPATGLGSWLAAPPFFPPNHPVDIWTMSQKTGSLTYLVFSAGFSLIIYTLFVYLCDLKGKMWRLFSTFGQNALAAYIIQGMVIDTIRPFVPSDSPLWFVSATFALFFAIAWFLVRHLEKKNIFLRI